jgi:hypothetical protein
MLPILFVITTACFAMAFASRDPRAAQAFDAIATLAARSIGVIFGVALAFAILLVLAYNTVFGRVAATILTN